MKRYRKILLLFVFFIAVLTFSFQSRYFEIAKQIEIYNTLFKYLNMYYVDEINPSQLTEKVIDNTLRELDPYTNFYNEADVEDVRIRREGEYGGIGIAISYLKEGVQITNILKGYSADRAGLKVGDIIIAVNNKYLKDFKKETMSSFLKGKPNTKLIVNIKRQNQTFTKKLIRDKVILNPVPFISMINKNTGYIALKSFNEKASSEVKKAFKKLQKKGMQQLVFDLRSNPGGSLVEAIEICNFFIPKGKVIVTTKAKVKKWSNTYRCANNPLDLNIPIVVLINNGSASASEIFSGALQDYDRAIILGERSFGKGLVQRFRKLPYGTQMKLTVSKYYTPSGRCIQELDYTNRKTNGKVPKYSDTGVNEFRTEKGRVVYDGGGILPDVITSSNLKTQATKTLLQSKAIFNYATEFFYKNTEIASAEKFKLNDDNFLDFIDFLKKDTTFVTKAEQLFDSGFEASKKETIADEYKKLKKILFEEKIANILKNKALIKQSLQLEILKRYYFEEGAYKHKMNNDLEIKKAVTLLNDKTRYNKILSIK